MAKWCLAHHHRENFLRTTHWDDICEIMAAHDIAFSIGDGLRPGSQCRRERRGPVRGASRCRATSPGALGNFDVQVMNEGPGHVPMHMIHENVDQSNSSGAVRPPSIRWVPS